MKSSTDIEEYIRAARPEVQDVLRKMRQVIKAAAPEATEAIKYGMPTFVFHGNLVHFAAMKEHIGFYPTSSPIVVFKEELSRYKTSKGAVRFPIGEPIPFGLVRKIVRFRAKQNLAEANEK
jgi:uncharacterized protein YdhG (YjbR/CyaY superfamily)